MSLAVLEINDAALTIGSDGGALYAEPGFARLTAKGIETGEPARAAAWREPQATFHQYWQQLGEQPLPVRSKWARHFADIAFAQLKQLLALVGNVDRCVLAIPGSFSSGQLSLLLGMLNALSVKTVAVVDSALAARLHAGEPAVYVDPQLHQGVVSALDFAGGELAVRQQKIFPELAVIRLHNRLARSIAGQLIETARFDPLHDPATEQWIFDQLPHWLLQLQWQEELNLVMATPAGERAFRLVRERVAADLERRLSAIDGFLADWSGLPVVLSHSGAGFAGLGPAFDIARVVEQPAVVNNCLDFLLPSIAEGDGLRRLTSLRVANRGKDTGRDAPVALHLLHDHRALPLSAPVSIAVDGGRLRLTRGIDPGAVAAIVQQGEKLQLLHGDPGAEIQLPPAARPGAVIEICGYKLPLIEVGDD